MRISVIYGGPLSGKGGTTLIPFGTNPVLVRIHNSGISPVVVAMDEVNLSKSGQGYLIQPDEIYPLDYPVSGNMFAISPNAEGGELDVQLIPVGAPAPVASAALADSVLNEFRRTISGWFQPVRR